ncbi:PP2C family protein-serine/threonine phosphatase [Aliterella atlantica]|uniref:PPM-type phosphatase domain-containing protein n=1 Tax=Aliterella atlantica CENA595 TaxID=1618023 RepID=A0A0D9A021_9CYAN|nr:protein phosphatase 2C domain-containing protein [Aliterella atlantica]KJH72806.1 hypothetical protein UH38_04415 [Aliterella atlantica CENA595]
MLSSLTDPILIIQSGTCFQVNNFRVTIKAHLGKFADVDYFRVSIQQIDDEKLLANNAQIIDKLGLLRIGNSDGGLSRELQVRHALADSKMLSQLLFVGLEKQVDLSFDSAAVQNIISTDKVVNSELFREEILTIPVDNSSLTTKSKSNLAEVLSDEDYLEFSGDYEYLEEDSPAETTNLNTQKLLLLSYLPQTEQTLDTWLQKKHPPQVAIMLASQICQLFHDAYEYGWCFCQIMPQFIQINNEIKFYDLTNVHLLGGQVESGMVTEYCAPEVACNCHVSEEMSTYVVGILLYQAIHQSLPNTRHDLYSSIQLIPGIYQIINLCLQPITQDRIGLNQLRKALIESQNTISKYKVQWDIASYSTIGLSLHRLQNEDCYGVQQYSTKDESILVGALADGMGGMAEGEVASKLAVNTVLSMPLITNLQDEKSRENWLISVVEKANANVIEKVRRGGTTLSVVLAIENQLAIAHVGDSRIFLIRNGMICQLSEDHSLVASLLANGEITYQDSQDHPQRNVITKCLGAKKTIEREYVQTLSSFGTDLSLALKNRDILLLCSDGVWDLVPPAELAEIFTEHQNLKLAVNNTINRILTRGASDNSTLVALKCCISNQF